MEKLKVLMINTVCIRSQEKQGLIQGVQIQEFYLHLESWSSYRQKESSYKVVRLPVRDAEITHLG